MKEFLRNLLSIDEKKTSTLIFILFILVGFAMWQFIISGDIAINMSNLIITIIYVLGGVNVTDGIASALQMKKTKGDYDENL